MDLLRVCSLVVYSIATELYIYYHNLNLGYFHHPQKKPIHFRIHSPFSSSLPRQLLISFVSGFAYSEYFT